eukprot:768366-Hanusia_phi.AAC.8
MKDPGNFLGLCLLLGLASFQTSNSKSVDPAKAVYTGLIRRIGDRTSHVVSFGPDSDQLLLQLCVDQGFSTPDRTSTYYKCVQEYEEVSGTTHGRSNPSLGLSTFDSINQVWFHANGEDGFASAYLTSVELLRGGSIGQAAIETTEPVSFTLSSTEYNRADRSVFGVVTYSSGQHYLVKIVIRSWTGDYVYRSSNDVIGPMQSLYFQHIYYLYNASGIVPAISSLEPSEQIYLMIAVEDAPYLFALRTGMDPGGNAKDCGDAVQKSVCPECPGCFLWKRRIPGVLTSMEVYGQLKEIYTMIHNTSGHYFFKLELDTGNVKSVYEMASSDVSVVWSISSFAPLGFGMLDKADVKGELKLNSYSYMTRQKALKKNETGNITQVNLVTQGSLKSISFDKDFTTISQYNNITIEDGLIFTGIEAQSTTIPQAATIYPSFAHIDGGGVVNVFGGPFVDTATLSCRFTIVLEECPLLPSETFIQRCRFSAAKVSLSGVVWSLETRPFVFFTTGISDKLPRLSGSAKGGTIIQVSGVNINKLTWNSVLVLENSRCEFGSYLDPSVYMYDSYPTYNEDTCRNVTIGALTELYCAFYCRTPLIPHEYCLTNKLCPLQKAQTLDNCVHQCKDFVSACPTGDNFTKLGKCRATQATYQDIELNLLFAAFPGGKDVSGQRIKYGLFYYTGGGPPIVVGAQFTSDVTGLEVEFDTSTDRGSRGTPSDQPVYQTTSQLFNNPPSTFGIGAFVTWPSRLKMLISFGQNPTVTWNTFLELKPFTIASYLDPYAFASGVFLAKPVPEDLKPPTTAVITAPLRVSFCNNWTISGIQSKGGGGRPMGFGWHVDVKKIDLKTGNLVGCSECSSGGCECLPWVQALNARLAQINAARINIVFSESVASTGTTLTACVSPTKTCDLQPDYSYTWKLVTWSWLWSSTSSKCGSTPIPNDLWSSPEKYVYCPAMSMTTSDLTGCNDNNVNTVCAPWASSTTRVYLSPAPELQILGPSMLILNDLLTPLILQLRLLYDSVLACDGNISVALKNTFSPSTAASAQASTLSTLIRYDWQVYANFYQADTLAICSSAPTTTCQPGSTQSCLLYTAVGQGSTLQLPPNLLEYNKSYTIRAIARISSDTTLSPCSAIAVQTNFSSLSLDAFSGVFDSQTSTTPRGGYRRASNYGIVIDDSSSSNQAIKVFINVLNPLQKPGVNYEFTWSCYTWTKDLYAYWQLSSFFSLPREVVDICSCTADRCFKTWSDMQTLDLPASNITVLSKNLNGMWNITIGLQISIRELYNGNVVRTATTAVRFTVYPRSARDYKSGMLDPINNLVPSIDPSVVPGFNVSEHPVNFLYQNFIPNVLLLIRGQIVGTQYTCAGNIPNFANDINNFCWYFWEEMNNANLNDPQISRYNPYQAYSSVAFFGLNPIATNANSNFFVRLSLVKGKESLVLEQYTVAWTEVQVTVNTLPRNGYIDVSPSCGVALVTPFTLIAVSWNDDPDNLPLSYAFAYQRPGCDSSSTLFTDYTFSTVAEVKLPYCETGTNCTAAPADPLCSLVQVELRVRNVYDATQYQTDSVDVWKTMYAGVPNQKTSAEFDQCNAFPLPLLSTFQSELFGSIKVTGFVSRSSQGAVAQMRLYASLVNSADLPIADRMKIAQLLDDMVTSKLISYTAEALESLSAVYYETFATVQGISSLCESTSTDVVAILNTLQSIMSNAKNSKLQLSDAVLSNYILASSAALASLSNPSCLPNRLRRSARTLQALTTFESNILAASNFAASTLDSFCGLKLQGLNGDEKEVVIESATITYVFRRASEQTTSNFGMTAPAYLDPTKATPLCGDTTVTVLNGLGQQKVDVCVAVFRYNPVDYTSAKTGTGDTDGQSQRDYNVDWPISPNVCPVKVLVRYADTGISLNTDFRIDFDLSFAPTVLRNWFPPTKSSFPATYNMLAYHDIFFAGICEQWAQGQTQTSGSWVQSDLANHTLIFDNSGIPINQDPYYSTAEADACIKVHTLGVEPAPEKIAGGR